MRLERIVLLGWLLLSASAYGAEDQLLWGRVVDALDSRPLVKATVIVEGVGLRATTDASGQYRLALPAGTYRLRIEHPDYDSTWAVLQKAEVQPRQTHLYLWPKAIPANFIPTEASVGFGRLKGMLPPEVELEREQALPPPSYTTVPSSPPATIRVGRYTGDGNSCPGSPYKIDTIDFEDYVKGVVYGEIGVFRSISNTPISKVVEEFKTFAIAARTYALYFIQTQPFSGYDINDTACNQRYVDQRNDTINSAVDETRGMILVAAANPDNFGKYSYAASCKHYGTQPDAGAAGVIVPDPTSVTACVGSWCGHQTCAGHAVNPQHPNEGRCLVWGICQWGAVERSIQGDSYQDIIGHYQPNLTIRRIGQPVEPCQTIQPQETVLLEENGRCFSHSGSYWQNESSGSGGHCLWTYTTDAASVDCQGTWTLNFAQSGEYRLSTFTPSAFGQSGKAKYVIRHEGKEDEVTKDQSSSPDGWLELGSFAFAQDGDQWVKLCDNTGEPYQSGGSNNKKLVFDALKIVPGQPQTDAGSDSVNPVDGGDDVANEDAGITEQDNQGNQGSCDCSTLSGSWAAMGIVGLLVLSRWRRRCSQD